MGPGQRPPRAGRTALLLAATAGLVVPEREGVAAFTVPQWPDPPEPDAHEARAEPADAQGGDRASDADALAPPRRRTRRPRD